MEQNLKIQELLNNVITAADWSQPDDGFTEIFMMQNLKQFWLPEEISLSNDVKTWKTLSEEEREAYSQVLAGLTMLDTLQGDVGMNSIAKHVDSHQKKALLTFMGGMENLVHARSYSNIFLTLQPLGKIRKLFEWVSEDKHLQTKGNVINYFYSNIRKGDKISLCKALITSVALESFLFYSGFYYPLYMAGHGKLVGSGEIINLIIRDESIHGPYVGLIFQEIQKELTTEENEMLYQFTIDLYGQLLENEISYTRSVYDKVGLSLDVINFVKYNANRSLNILGYEAIYEHDEVNPIVLNGLNTSTKTHDFFSVKGNGYKKPTVVSIEDSDFYFDDETPPTSTLTISSTTTIFN